MGDEVLAHLRRLDLSPGSNLRTAAAGAGWVYALPSLALGNVVHLGAPSQPALDRLRSLADDVVVVRRPEDLPSLPTRVDLVVAGRGAEVRRLRRRPEVVERLRAAASPELTSYEERCRGGSYPWAAALGVSRGIDHLLSPLVGHVRTAVPADAPELDRWLRARGLDEVSVDDAVLVALRRRLRDLDRRRRPAGRAAAATPGAATRNAGGVGKQAVRFIGRVERRVTARGAVRRFGHLAGPAVGAVPGYVRDVAADSGIDLAGHRAALVVPGAFETQKVLVLLFPEGEDEPRYIAKIARSERVTERLDNAAATLRSLDTVRDRLGAAVPSLAFFGHHAGLAVLGEEVVEGAPFQERSEGGAACPFARGVTATLSDIATETARQVPGVAMAGAVADVVRRASDTYGLELDERRALDEQVEVLAAGGAPAVLQHGDPGTWNLVVRSDGGVTFLDWENGETAGVPLWDLFTFLRSYAVLDGRRRGRSRAEAERVFTDDSELATFARDAVGSHRARLGIDAATCRALFITCWAVTALREAARLRPADLHRSHHLQYLRTMLAARSSPGLEALFS